MSAVSLTKQNKALGHLDARRPSSRGRDDARPAGSRTPRGKKEIQRDLTPNAKTDARRSSAPSPTHASFIIGPDDQRPRGGPSPRPRPEDCFGEPNTWERKPRRQSSKHPDPVLQTRTHSSPLITVTRQFSDGLLTYAQAAGSASTGALQRTSVTTVPGWAIQRTSPTPAPVSSRKYSGLPSPALKKSESIDTQSDIAPSVFDEDDDYVNSDLETEISTASLDALPRELNRDERLMHPEKYYHDLEELEANVAGNSGLFLMKRENRQAYPDGRYKLKFSFHGHGGTANNQPFNYDDVVLSFCNEHSSSSKNSNSTHESFFTKNTSSDLAYWAFHVLECRNLMLQVKSNLTKMAAAQYCNTSISILSVDPNRPRVAHLTKFEIEEITQLFAALEECLEMIVAAIRKNSQIHGEIKAKLYYITYRSEMVLERLRLPKGDVSSRSGKVGMWRKVVMIFDIGLISYCGAHIERFDETYLGEDLNAAKITAAWTHVVNGTEGIMLRRRTLSCLDGFLGSHKVWTFQSHLSWEDDQSLYLSTTIEQFADIWGPVWAAKHTEDSNTMVKYSTGSGSIVPWLREDSTPDAEEDEVLCHWVRIGEDEGKPKMALQPGTRLLIGASTEIEKKTSQLKVNETCRNSSHRVIQQLRMTNMLEDLGTRPPTRILAEETVGVSMGAYGVAMGGSKTYKRRSGITLKDAICDAWKHNGGNRNPAILEHFLGLEVSICSHNARRRRLKSILNTPTMRHWLEACQSNKEPFACEKAFHEALESRDRRAFRDLYNNHREWRRDLGQLVSWCLEGLRHSSVDVDSTLHALWIPQDHQRYRVKLRQNPHSWTGFLQDSETKCTFSIMTEDCLQTDYKYGGRCQTKDSHVSHFGLPVLETAMVVNRSAPLPKGLELRFCEKQHKQNRWSISGLQPDQGFQLCTGRLIVVERFAHTRLVVEWETGVLKKWNEVKQSLTRTVGKENLFHWELRDEEDWTTEKPIPLFVRSRFAVKG